MIDTLMIIAGLILLFVGGEFLVKGSVSLARNLGLSKVLVSSVIIGFGTSMPEMTVSVGAALKGSSDISLGNVVGSNIANILLIVGVAALICPILVEDKKIRRDISMMLFATVILCALALYGVIGLVSGLLMFSFLLAFIFYCYQQDRSSKAVEVTSGNEEIILPLSKSSVYSLSGLVLLIGGAYMLVEGGISLARNFGLSEAVIGLTIVAVGTSLPELATSMIASLKKQGDVVIGNILGSNFFNILAILGITSMIKPVIIIEQIMNFDLWVMLGVAIFLSIFLWVPFKINRIIGSFMVLLYVSYTAYLYTSS